MTGANQLSASEFLLLWLSREPEQQQQQQLLFMLFLSMYLASVLGNLLIILAISMDAHLHNPMYFFLSNLLFVEICFTSTTIPKTLVNHILGSQTISYPGCLTQMYFFIAFINMDHCLLAVMAYDLFVAVCHPLHYTTKMTPQLCALMVSGYWVIANLHALLYTLLTAGLSFCAYNRISHFFCDVAPLLKLTCSDTHISEMVILTEGGQIMITPLICILVSYFCITCDVLKISSAKGRWKAFSTCGSHLSVLSFFYGIVFAVYFSLSSTHSAENDIAAAVMYTAVTPMVNPFIYSLRNKDMKVSLRNMMGRKREST
ncbi:olfactory receptor 1F1-like [Echinops telfairi]|uniref:Olfactory receptor 1F1-like n=1 Tax=Echinops telfairi TaxID=9371 RepID=A0ABM0IRS2_ECHTE|nr:olfactory receptor 1F1-like [Echinops telfairi]